MSKSYIRAKAELAAKKTSKAKRASRVIKTIGVGQKPDVGSQPLSPQPLGSADMTKEMQRLNSIIAKMTAGNLNGRPRQRYYDEKFVAGRWGVSVKHIRTLRYKGGGPKVTYFGRSVRYRLRDIMKFERSHTFASRSDRDVREQK